MPALALLILTTLAPQPIDLDGISIDRARPFSGRLVAASFLSVKPMDLRGGWTVLGVADRDDAERGAFVRGRHFNLDGGRRVKVVGVLKVIDHAPAVVGGVPVEAWVELRVSEG